MSAIDKGGKGMRRGDPEVFTWRRGFYCMKQWDATPFLCTDWQKKTEKVSVFLQTICAGGKDCAVCPNLWTSKICKISRNIFLLIHLWIGEKYCNKRGPHFCWTGHKSLIITVCIRNRRNSLAWTHCLTTVMCKKVLVVLFHNEL